MNLFRKMADDFPDDVRSVVKDGAKARMQHTLLWICNASQIEHGQLSTIPMWMMPWRWCSDIESNRIHFIRIYYVDIKHAEGIPPYLDYMSMKIALQ